MKKKFFIPTVSLLSFILFSCASTYATGSYILTSVKKAEITPDKVTIYSELPPDYEVIGIVSASSAATGVKQKDLNYAIQELKNQAAKIGANGIIIESIGTSTGGGIVVYNLLLPVESQNVSAKAIFVPEHPAE